MNRMKKQGIQMDDDELHAERLNNGFYTLSKIALILADVCLSSYFTCKEKASNLFRMKTKNPSIKAHLEPILLEMLENLGEEAINQRERIELIISQLKIQEEGPSVENDEENGENGSSSEHVSESNDAVVEIDTSQ